MRGLCLLKSFQACTAVCANIPAVASSLFVSFALCRLFPCGLAHLCPFIVLGLYSCAQACVLKQALKRPTPHKRPLWHCMVAVCTMFSRVSTAAVTTGCASILHSTKAACGSATCARRACCCCGNAGVCLQVSALLPSWKCGQQGCTHQLASTCASSPVYGLHPVCVLCCRTVTGGPRVVVLVKGRTWCIVVQWAFGQKPGWL
jgi:hypothetical protein